MKLFKSCKHGVHKFEGRYDTELPEEIKMRCATPAVIEALKHKTYVHDICVKCGKIVRQS